MLRVVGEPVAAPIGVILAGGRGRRLGGDKASVVVAGRSMLEWSLASLRAVLEDVAVVAKGGSHLPPLPVDVALWVEPATTSHPLEGIAHALRVADGRAVLVCAVDLPLVDAATVAALLTARGGSVAVIATTTGGAAPAAPQPLLGIYEPGALSALAAAPPDSAVTEIVLGRLFPRLIAVAPEVLINVNRPEDIPLAEAHLMSR
ncbi:MAG: hypothetical protein DLM63_05050 [Solirubrobacterales bacterium]|nr:MAG: hypothetical protein DLM63_05050 [Solirubrobacterales bacterium]